MYTNEDVGRFKTLVIFDCRGVEPVDFEPQSGWIAEAEDNGVYLHENMSDSYINTLVSTHGVLQGKIIRRWILHPLHAK